MDKYPVSLVGLTKKYAPKIIAIDHSGISITSDVIKSKLLDMVEPSIYEHRKVSGTFATSQKYQQKNGNKFTVGNSGGYKDGVVNETNINLMSIVINASNHITKHYKNQCPSNDIIEKKNTRKQTNAFSAVFLSANFNRNE